MWGGGGDVIADVTAGQRGPGRSPYSRLSLIRNLCHVREPRRGEGVGEGKGEKVEIGEWRGNRTVGRVKRWR